MSLSCNIDIIDIDLIFRFYIYVISILHDPILQG
jgi:hypothetical protein